MAELSIRVCDICESPSRPVKHYRVECEDKAIEADLCTMHSGPLDKLLLALGQGPEVLAEPEPAIAPQRRPSRQQPVVGMDAVAKAKRRPRKKV